MLHISCNIGTRDLPDMYALSPRAYGPRALGIHIRQITRAYVTTITYIYIYIKTSGSESRPKKVELASAHKKT